MLPHPKLVEFKGASALPASGIPPCQCVTQHGAPDYVFLRLQRVYDENLHVVEYEPTIKTISLQIRQQDVKTISDLDASALYHTTRRNSNYRSDIVENYQQIGAVLLRRQDLGNWSDWDGAVQDPFDVSFRVTDFNTYNETAAEYDTAAVKASLADVPIRLVCTFVYKNFAFNSQFPAAGDKTVDCKFDFTSRQ